MILGIGYQKGRTKDEKILHLFIAMIILFAGCTQVNTIQTDPPEPLEQSEESSEILESPAELQ